MRQIEKIFWRESNATGASKAIASAWVQFEHTQSGVVVQVNEKPALRISIKYRETGPYLAVEIAPGSGESMGSCIKTAKMVKHYEQILESVLRRLRW